MSGSSNKVGGDEKYAAAFDAINWKAPPDASSTESTTTSPAQNASQPSTLPLLEESPVVLLHFKQIGPNGLEKGFQAAIEAIGAYISMYYAQTGRGAVIAPLEAEELAMQTISAWGVLDE